VNTDQQIWHVWAGNLQRWGLKGWATTVIETTGPLNVVGAQILYLIQPWIRHSNINEHLEAFIRILEDKGHAREFLDYLEEYSL